MEFEEMKKIWDSQNSEPLYAINEAALHKRIRAKMKRATRLNNINDFGLIIIAIVTAGILLLLNKTPGIYDYAIIVVLMLIAGYVLAGRIKRKKQEARFDRSMLGDLDHAIANVQYEGNRSLTMHWWFIIPLAIPVLAKMLQKNTNLGQWLLVTGLFILSIIVIRWDHHRCILPRKRKLEALRRKLADENNSTHI